MGEQTTPAGRPAVRIPAEPPQPDTWTPVTWDTEATTAVPAFKVGSQVLNRTTDQVGVVIEPGTRVAVQYSDDPGVVAAGAEWENPNDLVPLTDEVAQAEDTAGPAPSSASTSGTGGLADTAAQLAVSAKDLARLARDVREEMEGRRRELWGLLVEVACEAEETKWETPALVGKVMGLRSAYRIVTGIGTADLNKLLATELDRAKGGEPRG